MNIDIKNNILIKSIEHSNLAHTISSIDGDMELIYVNQTFLDETGYTRNEVIGRNCRFLQGDGTDPQTVQKIRQALEDFKSLDIEILNYRKDGTPFWNRLRMSPVFDEHDKPIAFIGIQSDITEIKEQNRIDQERQKLEALGRMTGNISHEIKNALQPVKLMAEALNDWNDLNHEQIKRCIDILNDNVNLADKITRDVLRFSRKSNDKREKIDIATLKADVLSMTKNLLHSRIDLEADIQDDETDKKLFVEITPNHLQQVMINLINNALHAMDDKGKMTLHIEQKKLNKSEAKEIQLQEQSYICISIEDTGCGMDAKTMEVIFDPFFSTKSPDEGTGLGLSISYRIAKEWNGAIDVHSTKGKGSTFVVYIPLKNK